MKAYKLNNGFVLYWYLSKNKTLEFQVDFLTKYRWFEYLFSFSTKEDHAGFRFKLSLLKLLYVGLSIIDNRHWDDHKNDWK